MTRDEYLVRDFLLQWLYPRYVAGTYRVQPDDLLPYLHALAKKKGIEWSGEWSPSTTDRASIDRSWFFRELRNCGESRRWGSPAGRGRRTLRGSGGRDGR